MFISCFIDFHHYFFDLLTFCGPDEISLGLWRDSKYLGSIHVVEPLIL